MSSKRSACDTFLEQSHICSCSDSRAGEGAAKTLLSHRREWLRDETHRVTDTRLKTSSRINGFSLDKIKERVLDCKNKNKLLFVDEVLMLAEQIQQFQWMYANTKIITLFEMQKYGLHFVKYFTVKLLKCKVNFACHFHIFHDTIYIQSHNTIKVIHSSNIHSHISSLLLPPFISLLCGCSCFLLILVICLLVWFALWFSFILNIKFSFSLLDTEM